MKELRGVPVIIEFKTNQDKINIIDHLLAQGFKLKYEYSSFNGIAGNITKSNLELLEKNSNALVYFDFKIYTSGTLADTKKLIGADKVRDLGYTGSGETICFLDTGVDYTLGSLGGCFGPGCKVVAGYDFVNNDANPTDDNGHGTHVAGIATVDGGFQGVSPKAKIAAVKVLDEDGTGSSSDIIKGIDWCVGNSTQYDISIISASLGDGAEYGPNGANGTCPTLGATAINSAVSQGIHVVAASGNENFLNGISWPACNNNVTSVGAVYDQFTIGIDFGICDDGPFSFEDDIACFTNRGTNLDLLAPGVEVLSLWHHVPFFKSLSGTSQAAPHVSGSIALLKEADDTNSITNSPMHIRELLKESGKQIYDSASGLRIPRLDIFKAFAIDWPFFHHDLRRTGFTLLKGDLDATDIDQASFTIDRIDNTFVDFPVLADVSGDDKQEILVAASRFGAGNQLFGAFFALECIRSRGRCRDFRELWQFSDGTVFGESPSVDDLNNDGRKEVIFVTLGGANNNGIVYAFDGNRRGGFRLRPQHARWKYNIKNTSALDATILHNAIADINLDGKKEILVSDYYGNTGFQAYLYVLEVPNAGRTFNLRQQILIGTSSVSDGAAGAIAVANINASDDNPEIVLPASFGIFVYRYDGNQLVKVWNNSHAAIAETALISDIDADNRYEIVYATSDDNSLGCGPVSCTKKLYVVDGLSGNTECSISLPDHPISSPAVGNLDSDKELEIAIVTRNALGSGSSYGHVRTFEHNCTTKNTFPSTNNYDTQRSSADIADIDNDGNNDVIFSVKNGTLYIMNNALGLKWTYRLGGEILGTPALGDIDDDGTLEIVAKHVQEGAGGQSRGESFTRVYDLRAFKRQNITFDEFTILNTADSVVDIIGGNNSQPELEFIDDIYAIESNFINVTAIASDWDNDTLTFIYSSPLNESTGDWNTTLNDSGVYEVFVGVSDKNLTDSQFLTITVFEKGTIFNNSFSDNSKEKNLTFEFAGENETVNINIVSVK